MKALVAYASEHGSTGAVAQRIAERLRERGVDADVKDVDEGRTSRAYDAVVLGSAVHGAQWLPQALQFLDRNQEWLADKPLWLFSVGLQPGARRHRGPFARMIAGAAPPVPLPYARAHHVVEHRAFAGVLTPDATRPGEGVLLRLLGARFGDFRDWHAIDGWADGIAGSLLAGRAGRNDGNTSTP
ncbi:MAG: flavodoxin domain-containing protein [Actinomycetes bacterium]